MFLLSISPPQGLFGNSDWTFEAWMLHTGFWNSAAESGTNQNPTFQWGLKATTTCGSAHFGFGSSATDGAGGHYVSGGNGCY